jgi:hypothetical protein
MSTKGHEMTASTKLKISKANTTHLLPEFLEAWERYETRLKNDPKLLPTIVGYCLEVGIPNSNILEYTAKYPEVNQIVNNIVDLQQAFCLENGITQKVNPIFSMFLLKSKHNYRDIPSNLTQNNTYMNISPDVLKDALALMGDKHDKTP